MTSSEELRQKYQALISEPKDLHWAKRLRLALSEAGQDLYLAIMERDLARVEQRRAEKERDEARTEYRAAQGLANHFLKEADDLRKERDEALSRQADAHRAAAAAQEVALEQIAAREAAEKERDEARRLCRETLIRFIQCAHAHGERTGNLFRQWGKKYPWLNDEP